MLVTIRTLFIGVVLLLGACAGSDSRSSDAVICSEPRKPMCTRDYMPVCGVDKTGVMKTYNNSCDACANPAVSYFIVKACDTDPAQSFRPGRTIDGE